MDLWVRSDQVAALESPFGAVGVAVVSDEASALGITALPQPYQNQDSGLWFVHQFWAVSQGADARVTFNHFSIDSKAMRKVDVGQDIVELVENASGADGVQFIWSSRMLIKTN